MSIYCIDGRFLDKEITKNDKKQIKFAVQQFTINVEADDMKKAHDIAMDYMPEGSVVTSIYLRDKPRILSEYDPH